MHKLSCRRWKTLVVNKLLHSPTPMRCGGSYGGGTLEGFMETSDKQELVRLLHLYMDDIVADNEKNIAEAKKHEKRWEGNYNL